MGGLAILVAPLVALILGQPLLDRGPSDLVTIRYVVRDPNHVPVEGALAAVYPYPVEQSTRTDAEGRGSIVLGRSVGAFQVGALRYRVADVTVPDPIPELLPIVLAPAAGFDIEVSVPAGCRPESFPVRLVVEGLMHDVPFDSHPIEVAAGATPAVTGKTIVNGSTQTYRPNERGRVTITGVHPGISFRIALLDGLGQIVADARAALDPGEWREVALRVTHPPRSLRGIVRDAEGRFLADARVRVDPDPKKQGVDQTWGRLEPLPSGVRGAPGMMPDTTNREGLFAFYDLFASSVDVTVSKPGYATRKFSGVLTPPEWAPGFDVVLEPGCDLTVTLEESDGTPIWFASVWASAPGYPREALVPKSNASSTFVLSAFPAGVTATIVVDWAGREWTREVRIEGDHVERIVLRRP